VQVQDSRRSSSPSIFNHDRASGLRCRCPHFVSRSTPSPEVKSRRKPSYPSTGQNPVNTRCSSMAERRISQRHLVVGTPLSGTSPARLIVSVNPGIPAGTNRGIHVTVSPRDPAQNPSTFLVTLTIAAGIAVELPRKPSIRRARASPGTQEQAIWSAMLAGALNFTVSIIGATPGSRVSSGADRRATRRWLVRVRVIRKV